MLYPFCSVFVFLPAFVLADWHDWVEADKCQLQNGTEGRCLLFEQCPKPRAYEDNPSCGSGKFPDTCCESKKEDFYEIQFGRVARRVCEKHMAELFSWQNYGLVFGGVNAQPKEYTFMAALGYGASVKDIKFHCGGSLISQNHVLTAAHCLFSPDDGPVRYVLLGELDMNSTVDEAEPQYLYVKNVTAHPEYRRSSVYHDIAILELDRPVRFTQFVKPACLDYGQHFNEINETAYYATGWGYVDTNGNRHSHLQEVQLVEYDFDRCIKSYPATKRRLSVGLQYTQMCAGGATQERKDTCQGDSGGPLSRHNDDIRYSRYKGYVVVGVTSFGKLCGYTNAPGVYTRVRSYIPWIESVVWPNEDEDDGRITPPILPQSANTPGVVPFPVPAPEKAPEAISSSFAPPIVSTDNLNENPVPVLVQSSVSGEEYLQANVSDLTIEPAPEVLPMIGTDTSDTNEPGAGVSGLSETGPALNQKPADPASIVTPPVQDPPAPRPIYVVVENPQMVDWAALLGSHTTVKVQTTTTTTTYTSRKPVNLIDFHAFTD